MVVVDASALVAVAFGEPEARAIADRIDAEDLHAPDHVILEILNATVMRCRRFPDQRQQFIENVREILSREVGLHAVDATAVLGVALETGLTAYDAAYLWLARHLGMPLVTLDKKLAAAAARH